MDRYFGAASTAPATVFGILLTNANKAHLPKLRKTNPGAYQALQKRLEEILTPVQTRRLDEDHSRTTSRCKNRHCFRWASTTSAPPTAKRPQEARERKDAALARSDPPD